MDEVQQKTPSKKSFPLWPLIILIFLLLGLTAFLAYQNWQLQKQIAVLQSSASLLLQPKPTSSATPDPITNWKTYTNTNYKIFFKFPENIYKVALIGEDNFMNYPITISTKDSFGRGLIFDVDVSSNTTTDNYFKDDKGNFNAYIQLNKEAPILVAKEINGYPAKEVVFVNSAIDVNMKNVDMMAIYFQRGNDVYRITLPNCSDCVSHQILSTFKFLD